MTPQAAELASFNAAQARARASYYADTAVHNGYCATCHTTPKDGHMRRCWTCRRAHHKETP